MEKLKVIYNRRTKCFPITHIKVPPDIPRYLRIHNVNILVLAVELPQWHYFLPLRLLRVR